MFIYVCMYGGFNLKGWWNIVCMCVCMYVCMKKNTYKVTLTDVFHRQGDFRLMSFTAGRCSTPLIPNDQLRRNGVRSSDLIVCRPHFCVPSRPRMPIATNPDRRTSEASPPVSDRKPPAVSEARPPASDRKDFTDRTALIIRYCFDPERSVT